MVDVTIISNLIPDRASFDHFLVPSEDKKKCITVLTNLRQFLEVEKWINYLTFDSSEFFEVPGKKVISV